mgnify:CR=1 FL=1
MNELLSGLFVKHVTIPELWRLGMLVPLTLSISIVYKTMRCEKLSSVPMARLVLCLMILTCMGLIGVVLLGAFRLLA